MNASCVTKYRKLYRNIMEKSEMYKPVGMISVPDVKCFIKQYTRLIFYKKVFF